MITFSSYPGDPRPRRAAEALAKEGMHVDVICLGEPNEDRRAIVGNVNVLRILIAHRRTGVLSYALNYSTFLCLAAMRLAARTIGNKYDLVYVHNMPDILVLTSLVPKLFGAKVILDMHDPMPELMTTIFNCGYESVAVRVLKRLERWSMARTDLVITVNEACRRMFSSRSCRPEKIGVVMNAPSEALLSPQWKIRERSKDASIKRFVIMYHGTLVERNGLDLAVEALARVRQSISTAELRVYGRGTSFLERVMKVVRDKHLEDSVHFLGPRSQEDLGREIEESDVGIIPNHRSPFAEINTPTRIFEYLALGKPVVAPRTPGIQDYFSPQSLLFFEPGSCEELAQKIEYVFFNRAATAQVVLRGQEVYRQHSWSREREVLVNLVHQVLDTEHGK